MFCATKALVAVGVFLATSGAGVRRDVEAFGAIDLLTLAERFVTDFTDFERVALFFAVLWPVAFALIERFAVLFLAATLRFGELLAVVFLFDNERFTAVFLPAVLARFEAVLAFFSVVFLESFINKNKFELHILK